MQELNLAYFVYEVCHCSLRRGVRHVVPQQIGQVVRCLNQLSLHKHSAAELTTANT